MVLYNYRYVKYFSEKTDGIQIIPLPQLVLRSRRWVRTKKKNPHELARVLWYRYRFPYLLLNICQLKPAGSETLVAIINNYCTAGTLQLL
jgi:hypothetical protein